MKNYLNFILILFCSSLVFGKNTYFKSDSISFKADGFNSSYELTLCENNEFIFHSITSGCLVWEDENGNKRSSIYYNTVQGKYQVKGHTIIFEETFGKSFFLDKVYDIVPFEKETLLIDKSKDFIAELKNIKETYNEPFPDYLIDLNELRMFTFFYSEDVLLIDEKNKKTVYNYYSKL